MVETLQEIDKDTYIKLLNNDDLLKSFCFQVATNSFFKPYAYGFYGCNLYHDVSNRKYYVMWKHRGRSYERTNK